MKKSIFLFFAAILCAMTANAWGYKTAAGSWNDCSGSSSKFTNVTMLSGKSQDVVMLTNVGDGLNILQNECDGHTLYCKWTKATGDIFRGTARWNNGLYCDETVVIPEGKVYIKVGSGTQAQMTAGADYTYTADVTFSTTGESYTIFGGTVNGATIESQNNMPSDGKPSTLTMSNSYTSTNSGSVHIVFDLKTNKVTETAETPEPVEDVTVHFINSVEWEAVACHHWVEDGSGTSWPGDVLTKSDEIAGYDVYTATFTGEHVSCIFNNNNNGNQTANLTVENGKYYEYNTNTWYADKAAAEAALATPVVDVYTVVGSSSELGLAWDPTKEANDMEKQDDGSYKKVYSNVEVTADIEWKIAKNDGWWDGPTFNNTNQVLSIAKSGIYNVTFTLSADLATATAEAELLEETNKVADCFISGNAALTGGDGWKGNEFQMEYAEVTKTYSYTLTGLAAETAYELKVVLGGSWYGYEKLQTVPTGVESNGGNIAFTLAEAGDVVVTYNTETGINLTGNFAAPAPETTVTLYFVNADNWTNLKAHIWVNDGDSYKAWDASEALTDTGDDHNGADIYSYTFPEKYNRIIWKGDDKQTTDDVAAYDVAEPYYCQGVWYASLAEIPAAAEEHYYIAGTEALTGEGWNVAGLEMTDEDADGIYTYTFKDVAIGTYEFKVTAGDWENTWGFGAIEGAYEGVSAATEGNPTCNIVVELTEITTFTVNFNRTTKKITFTGIAPITYTYYLMGVADDWETGIEMTQNPDKAGEYMLTCQAISATDAVKVVKLADGVITDYYGNGTVKDGVEVTVNYDGDGNITLAEGTYNFYFDTNEAEKKLWIAAATDCGTEPTPDYTRTVTTGNFGTLCLPFGGEITGAVLYECVGRETGKVYLGSVTTLVAGVPYIFQATATELAVYSDGTTATEAGSSNGLHGTFDNETVVAAGNYILLNNELRPSDGTAKVNANRAYLVMSEVLSGAPQQMPGRRYIGMDVTGENEATGFENITNGENTTIKVIENGQLIIIRNGEKFNAQGQKL